MRRGRLNAEEKAFIADNADKLPASDIAKELNRNPEMIAEYIRLNIRPPSKPVKQEEVDEQIVIRQELRQSEAWKNLRLEFTADELRFVDEAYCKLVGQFKAQGGVMPAEETQILQAVKFEVLMSRNLQERKKAREDIARLEKIQANHMAKFSDPDDMSDEDKETALNLESQIAAARTNESNRTNEYTKLSERHEKLMVALKSTRDQRIKEIESRGQNFLGIIKMLLERDAQEREGRQLGLLKLAAEKAKTDLGELHVYEDGVADRPILSADTVPQEEETEEQCD